MAIEFTQYLLPRGDRKTITIQRPDGIEALSHRFIEAGGKYEAEVLTTGEVSLTAVFDVDGEPQDIAIKVRNNGPDVLPAVDELVRESVQYIEALHR
jgi:hypothetical protein